MSPWFQHRSSQSMLRDIGAWSRPLLELLNPTAATRGRSWTSLRRAAAGTSGAVTPNIQGRADRHWVAGGELRLRRGGAGPGGFTRRHSGPSVLLPVAKGAVIFTAMTQVRPT
jgi:hypothetical protein